MITAWIVKDSEGQKGKTFLAPQDAESHRDHILQYYRAPEALPIVHAVEIDKLSNQEIRISGHDLGYQFNQDSMGNRKFKRTITNISREIETSYQWYHGEAHILGRRVRVKTFAGGYWRYVEEINGSE